MNALPDVDTRELSAFVAVARKLNFRRAAACLHLSPSVVTRRVAGLELRFGVVLVHRDSRNVSLTDTGLALLPVAEAWLREMDARKREFAHAVRILTESGPA